MNGYDVPPELNLQALWLIVAVTVFGLFVWRSIVLSAIDPPPPPRQLALPPPAAPSPSPRSWFPSRREKLEQAIDLVRAETDHLLAKTAAAQASAGLVRARAELTALVRELEATQQPPIATSGIEATLSLRQIHHLLRLAQLAPADRERLASLFTARIEESS